MGMNYNCAVAIPSIIKAIASAHVSLGNKGVILKLKVIRHMPYNKIGTKNKWYHWLSFSYNKLEKIHDNTSTNTVSVTIKEVTYASELMPCIRMYLNCFVLFSRATCRFINHTTFSMKIVE